MRRPGADEDNLAMSDFWCDFCHQGWTDERPMVEGHQGSLICSACLTLACRECLVEKRSAEAQSGETPTCLMCLEERKDRLWRSPAYTEAVACERCIRQAAAALEHDPDFKWKRPLA